MLEAEKKHSVFGNPAPVPPFPEDAGPWIADLVHSTVQKVEKEAEMQLD
jgi:hypothetical protein